jgi:hypothetical protein
MRCWGWGGGGWGGALIANWGGGGEVGSFELKEWVMGHVTQAAMAAFQYCKND